MTTKNGELKRTGRAFFLLHGRARRIRPKRVAIFWIAGRASVSWLSVPPETVPFPGDTPLWRRPPVWKERSQRTVTVMHPDSVTPGAFGVEFLVQKVSRPLKPLAGV